MHSEEIVSLLNTLMINVTAFFRDRDSWDYLADEIIPKIIAHKKPHEPIRIWSAACASGEEAYTLSIILAKALGIEQFLERVKIYATDVDEEALTQARQGSYSAKEVMGIPSQLLSKYFEQIEQRYVFEQKLRRALVFGCHNMIQDAPISRIDLLVCRNALMYFTAPAQAKILVRFHFALNNNGFLFLGNAETLRSQSNLFTPVTLKQCVFTKVPELGRQDQLLLTNQTRKQEVAKPLTTHLQIWKAAFETSPVAKMVVDLNGFLTMANEQARVLFCLSPRDLKRPWQELELADRLVELRSCIEQIYSDRSTLILRDVEWSTSSGTSYLDVQVTLMTDTSGSPLGVSLTFTDVTHRKHLTEELESSNAKLAMVCEELECTKKELDTTNEAFQSSVEQLKITTREYSASAQS